MSVDLYGGKTFAIQFNKCYDINISIIGTEIIDEGEYSVTTPNCTLIGNHTYNCKCTDKWWFNMSFLLNTINSYTLDYNYTIKVEKSNSGGGGSNGGGGSGGGTIYNQSTGYNTTTNRTSTNITIPFTPITNNTSTNENSSSPVVNPISPVQPNPTANPVITPSIPINTSALQPTDTDTPPPTGELSLSALFGMIAGVLLFVIVVGILVVGFLTKEDKIKAQTNISAIKSKPKMTTEGEIQYIMSKVIKKHTK